MKPKRLRVLFILKFLPVNFTTSDAYFALPNWLSENTDLFLLCPKPSGKTSILFENQLAGLIHFRPGLSHSLKTVAKLNRFLKFQKIDVIMTGVDENSLIPGIILANFHHKPLIAVCEDHPFWSRYGDPKTPLRTLEEKIRGFILKNLLRRANRIICFIEKEVLDFLAIPKEKIVQLSNGVNDSIVTETSDETFNPPGIIGCLGSIEESKGAMEMLEVLLKVRSQGVEAKMILIGDFCKPEDKKVFEVKCNELGLRNNVQVTGYMKHERALQLLEDCAVCLHAYRPLPWLYYNQALKVGEYMALGKAVVSWDYPGVRRILENGRVGILVKPGDLNQMAKEVKRLFLDRRLREEFGQQAREAVKEKFVWSKIGQQVMRAIESTISKVS